MIIKFNSFNKKNRELTFNYLNVNKSKIHLTKLNCVMGIPRQLQAVPGQTSKSMSAGHSQDTNSGPDLVMRCTDLGGRVTPTNCATGHPGDISSHTTVKPSRTATVTIQNI